MFFWFIATSVISIGFIFRDPNFDNRLLIVGSVLPIADGVFGGARALHSITVSIVLLAVIMFATSRGSRRRKVLLGLPIGMFLHLVFDGAWNDTSTFWWPFTGIEFTDDRLPILDRGLLSVAMEAIGIAAMVWLVRRNRLTEPSHRGDFLTTGRLNSVPERMGGEAPPRR